MENKKKITSTIAGVVFVGFMFIGLGIGFILNAIVAGILIGMGAGFIAMGIVYALYRSKDSDEAPKE
jgi:hypothetical protein